MARPSRPRTPRPQAATRSRATKATSRIGAGPTGEVEVVEEAPGWGIMEGAGIVTAVLLVLALGFLDYAAGTLYGAGFLF